MFGCARPSVCLCGAYRKINHSRCLDQDTDNGQFVLVARSPRVSQRSCHRLEAENDGLTAFEVRPRPASSLYASLTSHDDCIPQCDLDLQLLSVFYFRIRRRLTSGHYTSWSVLRSRARSYHVTCKWLLRPTEPRWSSARLLCHSDPLPILMGGTCSGSSDHLFYALPAAALSVGLENDIVAPGV